MGVPAFFMWLSNKYPKIVSKVKEELSQEINGVIVPADLTQPNPNGFEVDNLYLDMNGIVHPCCHPEDRPAPETEEDMMIEIYRYLDRIMGMIRPRKLLYLAIDGVAPRAKMNQQRSRRFRAGQESRFKGELEKADHDRIERLGDMSAPKSKLNFDSNCITPGTPFMDKLSNCLKYYVAERLNSDPGWKDINVILSDASVPGEGEHKIMDYIRRMRNSPKHDPNTQHVLYGLDADLIMLSLATHEPRFKVLREEVSFGPKKSGCSKCSQNGHRGFECTKTAEEIVAIKSASANLKPFVFLHVDILREYLEVELEVSGLNFPYDFENAIDDWIFLIFFVGNDFLPHLPFLDIRENAIPKLITMWKNSLNKMGGYITKDGEIDFKRAKVILAQLATMEGQVFKRRLQNEPAARGNNAQEAVEKPGMKRKKTDEAPSAARSNAVKRSRKDFNGIDPNRFQFHEDSQEIYFGRSGFEERYYASKFGVKPDNIDFRKKVAMAYIEGLVWVLRYYYQGCCSWGWYYPYHYPPFASDFLRVDDFNFEFDQGEPLRPFEQLMGVLPVDSKQHLPTPLHFLMEDKESPIIDFYPLEFKLDLNGATKVWKALALLPFIEIDRLLRAIEKVYPQLTPDEHRRNSFGHEIMYIRNTNPLETQFQPLYIKDVKDPIVLDPVLSRGISGQITKDPDCNPHGINRSPLVGKGPQDIMDDLSLSARYTMPIFPADFIFPTCLLEGATPSAATLQDGDKDTTRNGGTQNFGRHDYQRHEYYKGRENYEQKTHHDLVKDGFITNGEAPSNYNNHYPQRGRGGYQGQRGGYQGQRGGYQGQRGGYQGQRGGYQNQGHRGGYQNQGQHGGYQGQSGGHQSQGQYGGYQGAPPQAPYGYQGGPPQYSRGGYYPRGGHNQRRPTAPPSIVPASQGRPAGQNPRIPPPQGYPRGGYGGHY